jgi:hypothetical protein
MGALFPLRPNSLAILPKFPTNRMNQVNAQMLRAIDSQANFVLATPMRSPAPLMLIL